MFVDQPGFAKSSRLAARIVDEIDNQDRLPQLLVNLVEGLAENSIGFAGGFGQSKILTTVHPEAARNRTFMDASTYSGGGYLLDPYYALYRAGRSGCFPLRDIAPEGFSETEYFRRFYTEMGVQDEIIHVATMPGQGGALIGVVREAGTGNFSEEEVSRHQAVFPFVAACARRCSQLLLRNEEGSRVAPASLDEALVDFGEGVLTPRESEVIGLVLYGHNTQSVAAQLEITADTVKLHRKHAYAKLRVSSQGELFVKFLEHLGLEVSE